LRKNAQPVEFITYFVCFADDQQRFIDLLFKAQRSTGH